MECTSAVAQMMASGSFSFRSFPQFDRPFGDGAVEVDCGDVGKKQPCLMMLMALSRYRLN
jgi:hypothetical protein